MKLSPRELFRVLCEAALASGVATCDGPLDPSAAPKKKRRRAGRRGERAR